MSNEATDTDSTGSELLNDPQAPDKEDLPSEVILTIYERDPDPLSPRSLAEAAVTGILVGVATWALLTTLEWGIEKARGKLRARLDPRSDDEDDGVNETSIRREDDDESVWASPVGTWALISVEDRGDTVEEHVVGTEEEVTEYCDENYCDDIVPSRFGESDLHVDGPKTVLVDDDAPITQAARIANGDDEDEDEDESVDVL